MRSPFKLSALLALVLLTFSLIGGTGVGAQGVEAPDIEENSFQPDDLEGLQYGVARSYSVDYEALFAAATPGADLTMPSGLTLIGGMVLEFDSNDNAAAGLDRMVEEMNATGMLDDEDVAMEEWDSGLGNRNISYVSTYEFDGLVTETVISIFQQDNVIYLITTSGSDVEVKDLATTFGQMLIDNDGSGEGEFNADGTSTGGLWDTFPSADEDLVAGLVPMDEIIYPEAGDDN